MSFFDLETTGTNINTDRIVEICYLKVYPNGNEEAKTLRINPEMHPRSILPCMAFMTLTWQIARLSRKWQRILPATLKDATWLGFNSNRFDIPVLAEREFLRAGVDIDMSKRKFVDVQVIFHKMEQRTLSAAYKFYCEKKSGRCAHCRSGYTGYIRGAEGTARPLSGSSE